MLFFVCAEIQEALANRVDFISGLHLPRQSLHRSLRPSRPKWTMVTGGFSRGTQEGLEKRCHEKCYLLFYIHIMCVCVLICLSSYIYIPYSLTFCCFSMWSLVFDTLCDIL